MDVEIINNYDSEFDEGIKFSIDLKTGTTEIIKTEHADFEIIKLKQLASSNHLMIKANELRIGNLIQTNQVSESTEKGLRAVSIVVNAITSDGVFAAPIGIDEIFSEQLAYVGLKGIELRPEILEKMGLEFISKQGYFNLPLPNSLYGITNIKIGTGPYLHQVQNLYFALTGEELNVQL
jgi:hypothetical protein